MEEDQESKRNTSRRRRSVIISLKDIPPLDPSSIPINSSLKPRTMMVPSTYNKVNEVEEGNAISSFSNIQIDPNSTRSVNTTTQETQLLTKPQEEDAKSVSKDESKKGSAKMVLQELCISKRWKPPVYDCCNVDGPCHMRLFTYKVVVEIRDSSGTTVLECFGDPKRKKKAAAEHAAEGALWFLDHAKRNHRQNLHQ
ncbi:Ribonuclease 3-like protein 1 [Raphanus sativus]|uniref:Ribonuclease 3-like protein 1 isoform X1 n=1 Tax=Raphanus sativus TaxID=3726 RepID=A0A6J0MCJ4_RAPSA|nr:ribonuclease 3-like protein 1 isoform X1 [Raphanus sativus]KAJ4908991.1 Ribonuclease 3-like protein 1 [Raphanus sativus]